MAKHKKPEDYEQQIGELTLDLQRNRADFENYRKRVEQEKSQALSYGRVEAISQILPLIDTIERATAHLPDELKDNSWVSGIAGLNKQLTKLLTDLNIKRINAKPGIVFNPDLHEAVQFDESDGQKEVIAEELRAGYLLGPDVLRHAMVKVTRR